MFLNRLKETGISESKYYASKEFNHAYGGANWLPNCTAYAISRVYEGIEADAPIKLFTDRNPGAFPNAKEFYNKWVHAKGVEPRVGSVLCWGKDADRYGHVAYVERVESTADGWHVLVSQSNYGGAFFETKEYDVAPGIITKGVGYVYQGACYTNINDPRASTDESKDQLLIFGDLVRVRKTANGEAYKGLYCPLGLYNVEETTAAGGYNWARLMPNYWVAYREDWATYYPKKEDPRIIELENEIKGLMAENANLSSLLTEANGRLTKIKELLL